MSDDKKRELLFSIKKEDFDIEYYNNPGNGGQRRDKVKTGVRIKHRESGASAQSCSQRVRSQNQKEAFEKLIKTPEFLKWHKIKSSFALKGITDVEREIKRRVDEAMDPKNIKVEVYDEEDKKWKEIQKEK